MPRSKHEKGIVLSNGVTKLQAYQMLRYHRKLWTWLSENPDCLKINWPGWSDVKIIGNHFYKWEYFYKEKVITNGCFACECFAECIYCPLNQKGCTLYSIWSDSTTDKTRKKLALQIRDEWKVQHIIDATVKSKRAL